MPADLNDDLNGGLSIDLSSTRCFFCNEATTPSTIVTTVRLLRDKLDNLLPFSIIVVIAGLTKNQ